MSDATRWDVIGDFEEALRRAAPTDRQATARLRQALADSVERPGRRVRARLVLETAEAAGVPVREAQAIACAVEFWHMASLLLDDLPCMDDARERRGGPCVHRVHGEATAILAALAFINRAYALVGEAFEGRPVRVRRLARELIDGVLGPAGLVGGQARDLGFAEGERTAREVGRVAWQKTGVLLWMGVALPAIWAGAKASERRAWRRLCLYWGLAYQAMDDVRDVLATSVDAGKTVQRDGVLRRPNLALAIGVPATRRRIERLLMQARGTVVKLVAEDERKAFLERWHEDVFAARGAKLRAA